VTERFFVVGFLAGVTIALAALTVLLASIVGRASPYLSPGLFLNYANFHDAAAAGYAAAIVGTLWIMGLTLLLALPIGMGAGIYLEEYARPGRILRALQAAVTNLAGVPSVVFGLLGLAVFVRALRPITNGPTVLAGALTLTILIFPYVVTTTQEAIKAVPPSIRDASLALGATKWQTIRRQVLPAAGPGLLTGTILTASRVMGETAPLIVIGAVALMTYLPDSPTSVFVALPVQIYSYIGLPGSAFQGIAAAGMVILLALLFGFNSVAIVARNRMQRRMW
jgi:phosphate transport system permease protein